jgi:hypothetical protein
LLHTRAKTHIKEQLSHERYSSQAETTPKQITYHVPDHVIGIIFTLRRQLHWDGHRISAELKKRGIAKVSGRTVLPHF